MASILTFIYPYLLECAPQARLRRALYKDGNPYLSSFTGPGTPTCDQRRATPCLSLQGRPSLFILIYLGWACPLDPY